MSESTSNHVTGDLSPLVIGKVPEGEDAVVASPEAVRDYCAPPVGHFQKRGDTWKVRRGPSGYPRPPSRRPPA